MPTLGRAIRQRQVARPLAARLPRVSVIVPTKNEALNLPLVLPRLPAFVTEVIVVDANSTDDTVAVARALRPDVRILAQSTQGKGRALRMGFEAARGDIIVSIDADGSTQPEEIESFVQALMGGADYVKGSRYIAGGGSEDLTPLRRMGNQVLTIAVRAVHRARFTDLCYGFNAFWADVLPTLDLHSDGFEIETEMNLRAHLTGLSIVEVPSVEAARIYGASNLHAVRDGLRVLRQIVRERRRLVTQSTRAWAPVPMARVDPVAIQIELEREYDDFPARVAG